ncbi:MAG: tetratricopeptide repeat protein [Byssovorax sp.]
MRCGVLALAVLIAAPGLVSCGGARDATDKELAELRSDLTKLRSDQSRTQERLDALEIARGGLRSVGGAALDPVPTSKPIDSDRPDLAVVRLAPDPDADDSDAPPLSVRSVGPGGTIVERSAKGKSTGGAQDDLDHGLELYKAKSWDKALEVFSGFLVKNPDHPSAEIAAYYRGECLLAKGDPRRAAEQFEGVALTYPQGTRAPDALLRAAQAYVKLGERDHADAAKKKLLAAYPGSDAAKKLASSGNAKKSGSEKKKP